MRKSKKQAEADRRLAWSEAVRGGRVVSYNGGERFKAFATVEEAQVEVSRLSGKMPIAIARPINVGTL